MKKGDSILYREKIFQILPSYDPDTFQTYEHVKDKYKLFKKSSNLWSP